MLSNLLFYRLAIVNLSFGVALFFAFQRGWVMPVLEGDSTRLVYAMAALFLASLVSLFVRAAKVSRLLNYTKRAGVTPRAINKAKFFAKQAHLGDISGWLVTLGLLGTVIGVSIALFGVDESSLGSAEGTRRVVTGLIAGMQVALYTTIVGTVLGFWADVNRRILHTATVVMLEDIRGGRHD